MSRVTGDEVKEIIDTTLTAAQITPFITAANITVTSALSSTSLAATTKKEIERWFSAHLVYIRNPQLKKEKIGDAEDTMNLGTLGEGLKSTPYGQVVLTLDTTGNMANLGKRQSKIEAIFDSSTK